MQTFCCTKGACVEGQLTSALHRLASEDLRSNSQGDTHTHTHTNTHHEGHKQELQHGTRLSNHTGEDLPKESISCVEVLVCLISQVMLMYKTGSNLKPTCEAMRAF